MQAAGAAQIAGTHAYARPGWDSPSARPGFDYLEERSWNMVTEGAIPYNGTAPVRAAGPPAPRPGPARSARPPSSAPARRRVLCGARGAQTPEMVSAAAGRRAQRTLAVARAPWAPAVLHAALPVTLRRTAAAEDAGSHVNVLAVRSRASAATAPCCRASRRACGTTAECLRQLAGARIWDARSAAQDELLGARAVPECLPRPLVAFASPVLCEPRGAPGPPPSLPGARTGPPPWPVAACPP